MLHLMCFAAWQRKSTVLTGFQLSFYFGILGISLEDSHLKRVLVYQDKLIETPSRRSVNAETIFHPQRYHFKTDRQIVAIVT